MPPIHLPELLIIVVIALIIFGPKKLPELARGLGEATREFRKSMSDVNREIENTVNPPETPATPAAPAIPAGTVPSGTVTTTSDATTNSDKPHTTVIN